MTKLFKSLIGVFALAFVSFLGNIVFAAIDGFYIEIKDTFNVGESVDFTVSAINNGEVFKEYSGLVIFDIYDKNGNSLDSYYYSLSSDGAYQFLDTDQGVKTFSKGLKIDKEGTYRFSAYGLDDTEGSADIVIVGQQGPQSTEVIDISYPADGSVESKNYVTVVGTCEKLKNSPIIIYVNGKVAGSGNTDAKGNFSIHTPNLVSGDNEIQAKIVDINNIVLGESQIIGVKYKTMEDGVYKSMEILPSNEVKQGDKVIFNITTDDSVSSAQLIFSDERQYSMDRVGQGMYSKEIEATTAGDIDVSLSLFVTNADEKIYEKVETLHVQEYVGISNIKFVATGVDGRQVIVSWDTIGEVSKYQINYGTGKENLDSSITVSSSNILIENLDTETTYYFQIVPQDNEAHTSGDPSDIVEYRAEALSCVVKGIKVKTERIGDNYYLVRDPVENAIAYEVYRSDWADMTDSRLVGSLTGTRFQYLYNPDATTDEYAFYQVQALCPDGKTLVVDQAQKVKVGPMENILLVIIISIFIYSLYRLNRISDE